MTGAVLVSAQHWTCARSDDGPLAGVASELHVWMASSPSLTKLNICAPVFGPIVGMTIAPALREAMRQKPMPQAGALTEIGVLSFL